MPDSPQENLDSWTVVSGASPHLALATTPASEQLAHDPLPAMPAIATSRLQVTSLTAQMSTGMICSWHRWLAVRVQKELRALLGKQGVNTKGRKPALVNRARALLQQSAASPSKVDAPSPSSPAGASLTMVP